MAHVRRNQRQECSLGQQETYRDGKPEAKSIEPMEGQFNLWRMLLC